MRKITLLFLVLSVGLITAQEFKYSIHKIDVNTKYSDFGVTYFGENEVVFASARRNKPVRTSLWVSNKQPYLELFKGTVSEQGEISAVKRFSKKISTKYHESNVTFTKDLKTIYFSRNNYLKKKFTRDTIGFNLIQMYKAHVGKDGKWIDIKEMPFNNDNYQTGHPVLNKAETKLYFTSDMPGSIGATDIFVVDLHEDGSCGVPKNLGPTINTVGKEMFPFIDEDGVLYFSSDGYSEGKGGLDMYAVKVSDPIHQEKPKNLGFPINSNKDDFSFVVRSGKSEGYFSSNRAGGKGDDDIYFFKRTELIKAACTQIANGVVREIGTNKLVPEAKVDLYDATGTLLESTFADANAKFSFKVACKSDYKTIGNKEGYDTATATFTSTDTAAIELNLGLNLKPLKEFINKRGLVIIDINMIYFDLDKSFIRQDAKKELEKVLKIMKKYPTLNIELGSHTDSRGSDIYNKALSERRAQATVAWLIDRGVNAANISAKGYGETQLVNNCVNGVICSELEHQLNRRTEFVVLNPEEIK